MSYQTSNTQSIKERHSEVYKEFFAKNDVVLSGDFTYAITGGLSWRVGAPTVRIKLPFRGYIGITPNNKKGQVLIGDSLYYNAHEDSFKVSEYELFNPVVSEPYFKNLFERKFGHTDFQGATINIFAERPEDRGYDTGSGQIVIMALYLFYGLIDLDTLKQFSKTSYLNRDKYSDEFKNIFDEIYKEGIKLVSITQEGGSSGSASVSSLLDSKTPVVQFTEERGGSSKKPYPGLVPIDIREGLDKIDHMKWWGFRLNELTDISVDFPLDVVSIFPGSARVLHSASGYVNSVLLKEFDNLRDNVKEMFSMIENKEDIKVPSFLQNIEQDGRYWQEYARGQMYVRLYSINSILKLYKSSLSTSVLNQFFETINSTYQVNAPFEESPSRNIQFIVNKFRKKANERGVTIGIHPLNWGKMDGNIFIFSRQKSFRTSAEEVVKDLRKNYDHLISMDFASWKDGWGAEGARIEQHLSNGIYSEFVDQNARHLIVWDKSNIPQKNIVKNVTREDFDILLDKINNKIYIKGIECTSKELPTQKAAIEVLSFLLEHYGQNISNKELPAKSYTGYRNEFQSKIVTPLNKVLKDQILGLKTHGKLTNFDVEFSPDKLKIGVLEKI